MKKLFTTAVVALVSIAAAAAPESLPDSLACLIGATQGASFSRQAAESYSGEELDVYRTDFMRGLTTAVLSDTVGKGFLDGLRAGTMMIGELMRMNSEGAPVNLQEFCDTFRKYYTGPMISEAEYNNMFSTLVDILKPIQEEARRKREEARQAEALRAQAVAEENEARGREFIEALKADDKDVQTTPSGLSFKVITRGEGDTVAADQRALVKYRGTFVDGTQFDARLDEAVAISPSQVIPGFGEGLKMMNKGSKYVFYIPSTLAYGRQAPPAIGPGQTLVFEVEMVDILK